MASEIAWVGSLSCEHSIGSVPPPMADPDPPIDAVQQARMAYAGGVPQARAAKPPEPFVPSPEPGSIVYCGECGEGRIVGEIIENVDQPLPQLDKRRAGTRW